MVTRHLHLKPAGRVVGHNAVRGRPGFPANVLAAPARQRLVRGQVPRRLVIVRRMACQDEWAVRVRVVIAHMDVVVHTRNPDRTTARALPRLRERHPARGLPVALALADPGEPQAQPRERVRGHNRVVVAAHDGGLRKRAWLLRLQRRAVHLVGVLRRELRLARVLAFQAATLGDRIVVHDLDCRAGHHVLGVRRLVRIAFKEERVTRHQAAQVAFPLMRIDLQRCASTRTRARNRASYCSSLRWPLTPVAPCSGCA